MTSDHLYNPEFGGEQSVRMMEQLYPVSREAGHAFSGGYDIFGREFGYVADRPYGRSIDLILWNPQHDRQCRSDDAACAGRYARRQVPRLVFLGRALRRGTGRQLYGP